MVANITQITCRVNSTVNRSGNGSIKKMKPKAGGKEIKIRNARQFAELIQERTDGGKVLLERLMSMVDDPLVAAHTRLAAIQTLLDRGMGKPMQPVEINHELKLDVDVTRTLDFSNLSVDQLKQWIGLIDATATEETPKDLFLQAQNRNISDSVTPDSDAPDPVE